MSLKRLDHRKIGLLVDLLEDPGEIANRLVIMDYQSKMDTARSFSYHTLSPKKLTGI